ncbi:MAG: DUF5309 domain-containing protein [Muribaculaceae bacterium]|nr:DUF5309 domain-containing protein [Muribaculaceae bacterium]
MNTEENLVAGVAGGTHVAGQPLTTTAANMASPGLVMNGIDQRIVKVRPMSTPIDQLSRCAGSRRTDGMSVEYASVDTRPTEVALAKDAGGSTALEPESGGGFSTQITLASPGTLDVTETLLGLPSDPEEEPVVMYVLSQEKPLVYRVMVVNPKTTQTSGMGGSQTVHTMAQLKAGSKLIRMGRAAAELDVQTAQFSALPSKDFNHCQIFKMQVEQSTLMKIAHKEPGWNFSDQEEAAIIDMRLGMEKSFLFGHRTKIYDSNKNQEVYLTGGIWTQAGSETKIDLENLDHRALTKLCSDAFVGRTGSKRKILIAGTALMEALSNVEYTKVVSGGESFVKWGIEFREIRSNFGTLYVLHSEIFDQCGHASDGFILDPDYLTKYVHMPFSCETLDLRKSGQRNTDAVVLTEASCLVLRYPSTHMRVLGVKKPA